MVVVDAAAVVVVVDDQSDVEKHCSTAQGLLSSACKEETEIYLNFLSMDRL